MLLVVCVKVTVSEVGPSVVGQLQVALSALSFLACCYVDMFPSSSSTLVAWTIASKLLPALPGVLM
jgi:hypothetical protein